MKNRGIQCRFLNRFFIVFISSLLIIVMQTDLLLARRHKKHQPKDQPVVVMPVLALSATADMWASGQLSMGGQSDESGLSVQHQLYESSGLGGLFANLHPCREHVPAVAALIRDAEEEAKRLEVEVDLKVSARKREADVVLAKARAETENKALQIQREADEKAARIREQAYEKSQALSQEVNKTANRLNKDVEQEVQKLKKEAAAKVVSLVNKADEEALKLRKKAREQVVTAGGPVAVLTVKDEPIPTFGGEMRGVQIATLEYQAPVSLAWKQIVWQEFNTDTAFMKQIIMEGEDQNQLPDFLKKFADQGYWFDKTLTDTQHVGDNNYNLLIAKKMKVGNVVAAQRKADTLLVEVARILSLTDADFKKVRLLALYELNAFAQRTPTLGFEAGKKLETVTFNDQLIKYFVSKVVQETTGKAVVVFPTFKPLDDKEVELLSRGTSTIDLEREVAQLKTTLAQEQREKVVLRETAKQKLEEVGSKNLDLEVQLKTTNYDLGHYKGTSQTLSAQKGRLVAQVESLGKEYIDLTLQMTGVQQKMSTLDRDLQKANNSIEMTKQELVAAREEADSLRLLVARLQEDLKNNKKTQKQLKERMKLVEEVADSHVTEHRIKTRRRVRDAQDTIKRLEKTIQETETQLKTTEKKLKEKDEIVVQKSNALKDQEVLLEKIQKTAMTEKERARLVEEVADGQVSEQRIMARRRIDDALDAVKRLEKNVKETEKKLKTAEESKMLTLEVNPHKVKQESRERESKELLEQELERKAGANGTMAPAK